MSAVLNREQGRTAWVFVLPALALFGVFFIIPVLGGFVLSLTDFDIYAIGAPGVARFIGAQNYERILANPMFWQALRNTMVYVVLGTPLSVIVSLAAALLLNAKGVRLRGLFRTIYFVPVVTTLVAVAIVWRYIYHPHYGLLNYALGAVGIKPIDWLGDPHWAMPAIILMAVWKNFGYNMLIFVAGLQTIPEDLYEAAAMDGASWWWRFVHVTLPGLAPVFLFVSVTTMIGQFQLFSEPYVMTQGGPLRSTTSLVLLMYEEGFRWWRLGMASALAFTLLIITLFFTLIQMRLQKERT